MGLHLQDLAVSVTLTRHLGFVISSFIKNDLLVSG